MHSVTFPETPLLRVLLATAQVRVMSPNANVTTVRALIDQGSEISLISERTVQRLKIARKNSTVSLVGIGGKTANKTRGIIRFRLSPHFQSDFECTVTAYILTNLTSIPSVHVDKKLWSHLERLQLADSQFSCPGAIDLVLRADVYGTIMLND